VSEVRTAILEDAREEMAGALPLVENALSVLWEKQEGPEGNRLSGEKYRSLGKLAGILASQADSLLASIDAEIKSKAGVAGRGVTVRWSCCCASPASMTTGATPASASACTMPSSPRALGATTSASTSCAACPAIAMRTPLPWPIKASA
jgi:hypothetical protein